MFGLGDLRELIFQCWALMLENQRIKQVLVSTQDRYEEMADHPQWIQCADMLCGDW